LLRLKIETDSSLMLGSGSGRGSYIDSDIIVDDYGLPYFPARRLKGLLRESALEVMEMLQQSELEGFMSVQIDKVFGSETTPSNIHIENLYPLDYQLTLDCLKYAQQEFSQLLNKEAVISALTDVRQQTAINNDGFAREGSLRTIRVLRTPYSFEGIIEVLDCELKEEIENMLALACLNIRRVGSSRNRGWGEIICTLYSEDGRNLGETVIAELKNWNPGQRPSRLTEEQSEVNKNDAGKSLAGTKGYSHKIEYKIANTAPLLFTSPDGDENMVTTLDYIPGSAVHGYYANQLIKNRRIEPAKAQEDVVFRQWFLEGYLGFSNALLVYNEAGYEKYPLFPTPLFIHTNKQKDRLFNLINEIPKDSQAIRGYVCIEESKLINEEPAKAIDFHLVRNANSSTAQDRIDGHGNDGGIFHYQALKAGQEFHGCVMGSEDSLKVFQHYFIDESDIRLGRSTSTQYGSCRITFGEIEENTVLLDNSLLGEDENSELVHNQLLLYFVSPVVLYNDYGYASVSTDELACILEQRLGLEKGSIEVIKSFAREMESNSFIAHWRMPEPSFRGWAPGSSFLLQFKVNIDESLEEKITSLMREGLGEKRPLGFGQVRFVRSLPEAEGFNKSELSPKYNKPENPSDLAKRIMAQIYKDSMERITVATAAHRADSFCNKNNIQKLSSNLLGRLERMVQDSQNPGDLAGKINELREKAMKPLKELRLNESNLFEELTNMKLEDWLQNAVENELKLTNKLRDEFDIKLNDADLYKKYWQVFLRTLRKRYKESGIMKEGGDNNAMSE